MNAYTEMQSNFGGTVHKNKKTNSFVLFCAQLFVILQRYGEKEACIKETFGGC